MPDVLASAGSDSASIDISIPSPMRAGRSTHATVEVRGGTDAVVIEDLDLVFVAHSGGSEGTRPDGPTPRVEARRRLADRVRVHPAEHRVLDTAVPVPPGMPVSLGGTRIDVALTSGSGPVAGTDPAGRDAFAMEIERPHSEKPVVADGGTVPARWAAATLAAGPAREIDIRPGARLSQVLDAVSALGFFLVRAVPLPGNVGPSSPVSGPSPTRRSPAAPTERAPSPIQEFQFRPRWGPFREAGDLFLYPLQSDDRLEVGVVLADPTDPPSVADGPPPVGASEAAERLTVRDTDGQAVRRDLRRLLELRSKGT